MGSSGRRDDKYYDSKRSSSGWKRSRSISSDDSYDRRDRRDRDDRRGGDDRRGDDRRGDDRRGRDDRRGDDRRGDDQRGGGGRYYDDRDRNRGGGGVQVPPRDFNCHLCTGPSHWTRECPFVRNNPQRFPDIDPVAGCHQCGKSGHKLNRCPNKKFLCRECAGMHVSKTCPNNLIPREFHAFYSPDADRVFYERVRPAPHKALWSRIRGLASLSTTSSPEGQSQESRLQQDEKLAAQKEEDNLVKDWPPYGRRCRSPTRPWISWFVQPHDLDVVLWHCPKCTSLQPSSVTTCVGCGDAMPEARPAPLAEESPKATPAASETPVVEASSDHKEEEPLPETSSSSPAAQLPIESS